MGTGGRSLVLSPLAGGRQLIVDDDHPGTPESTWRGCHRIEAANPLVVRPWRSAVVVAPHPDDEVLGAGGLISCLGEAKIPTLVVAVTDGEGSHPGSAVAHRLDLRSIRAAERTIALGRLQLPVIKVRRLLLADGGVAEDLGQLVRLLTAILGPDDVCIAPWSLDGHPDHDASGQAARIACSETGAELVGYLIWAWHWAAPAELPWDLLRRLDLSEAQASRKRRAIAAYRSQITALGEDPADGPVLPAAFLSHFRRPNEIFVSFPGAGDPQVPTPGRARL